MKCVLSEVETLHLGIPDLDALGVAVGVDVAGVDEPRFGGGRRDQLKNDLMADQRLCAPIL